MSIYDMGLITEEQNKTNNKINYRLRGDHVENKVHGVHDSMKHVKHTRNHTMPGVGRHS